MINGNHQALKQRAGRIQHLQWQRDSWYCTTTITQTLSAQATCIFSECIFSECLSEPINTRWKPLVQLDQNLKSSVTSFLKNYVLLKPKGK